MIIILVELFQIWVFEGIIHAKLTLLVKQLVFSYKKSLTVSLLVITVVVFKGG